jgi:poly(A) polymerase
LYRLGAARFRDLVLLAAADDRIGKARLDELLAQADSWIPPAFPLAGRDVTALGIPTGPRVGQLLAEVRRWWKDGDFAANRAACLARLRKIVAARE